MAVIERLAEISLDSKWNEMIEAVRLGWNGYSFIFYIGGVSAILGAIFGVAGWLSIFATLLFFYYAGKFKRQQDLEKSRKPWKR